MHLCDFPTADPQAIDEALSERMSLVREVVSLGRAARMGAKLKVRQPLAKVEVILLDRAHRGWLEQHSSLIAEELNVKQVEFTDKAEHYITYTVLPDLKRLGPRLGKQLPEAKQAIAKADAAALLATLEKEKQVTLDLAGGPIVLDALDLQVRLQAKPGWAAAQGASSVVVLSTDLDESLLAEGAARELVHAIQTQRKDMNCQYTDRIEVGWQSDDPLVRDAAERFASFIKSETLAAALAEGPLAGVEAVELKLGNAAVKLWIRVVTT